MAGLYPHGGCGPPLLISVTGLTRASPKEIGKGWIRVLSSFQTNYN